MQTRQLGQSDLRITPIVLGTWALGGWLWGGTARNRATEAIQAAIAEGINCIDTAPAYGFGLCEELVGQAIRGRRGKVLVATKCGLVWDERPGNTFYFDTKDDAGRPVRMFKNLRKTSVFRECDASLTRLGVDEIDLYQCHWPDGNTAGEETVEALLTLQERGKIRHFGVSNFSAAQLAEFRRYGPLTSDQPKYSLLSRDVEKEVLPFCREHKLGVICYSPLERGLLTGKVTKDQEFPENDGRRNQPWFQPKARAAALAALEEIRPLARKLGVSLGQLCTAWVAAQPGVTAAIVGARDGQQARENAVAGELVLDADVVSRIREVFEPVKLEVPFDPANAKR